MPHKWSHVIKAYADGCSLQYRNTNFDDEWIDVLEGKEFNWPNFNIPDIEWRVKPSAVKYRIAMYFDHNKSNNYYALLHDSYNITEETTSKHPYFIQWLTDWVEFKWESTNI